MQYFVYINILGFPTQELTTFLLFIILHLNTGEFLRTPIISYVITNTKSYLPIVLLFQPFHVNMSPNLFRLGSINLGSLMCVNLCDKSRADICKRICTESGFVLIESHCFDSEFTRLRTFSAVNREKGCV